MATVWDISGNTDPISNSPYYIIDWGDGSESRATLSEQYFAQLPAGTTVYDITGWHYYGDEGLYPINVYDAKWQSVPQAFPGTLDQIYIRDLPISGVSGGGFKFTKGVDFRVKLGQFNDADYFAPPYDFTAIINWGDGTSSSGGYITRAGSGGIDATFDVTGEHTYANSGTYMPSVTIRDDGGSTTSFTDTATPTPEPSSLLLLGSGVLGLAGVMRRKLTT